MKTLTKIIYSTFAVVLLTLGALRAGAAPGDLFVSVNGTGENGAGSMNQYRPTGLFRIGAAGLSGPRGMAFNSRSKLFVANTTFDDVTQTFQASKLLHATGRVRLPRWTVIFLVKTWPSTAPAISLSWPSMKTTHQTFPPQSTKSLRVS